MAKRAAGLTALKVEKAKKPGYLADGGGLYLQVTASGAKSWVYRYQIAGRRRDMGLGSVADVSLAKAREKAAEARALVKAGTDPLEARKAAAEAAEAAKARSVTFNELARQFLESHEAGWRNAKHRQQWQNTLATYAAPIIGALPIGEVQTHHVLSIIGPLWAEKTETASRLRGRIEVILDAAKVQGLRSDENPARWRGHLERLLPAKAKVSRAGHHEAMPYKDLPAWWPRLQVADGIAARCLEWVILTACRSGEARLATWAEIDLDAETWVIPADRMKAGREHRIPLSGPALAVLRKIGAIRCGDLVFPGARGGRPLSDMSVTAVLRRMDLEAVPHGFRSSFRTWAAEQTTYPAEVAEAALAHVAGDKVVQAYQRGDMIEIRRRLMADWAAFVTTPPAAADVLPIRRRA